MRDDESSVGDAYSDHCAFEWGSRILIMFDNYVVQDLLTFTEADIKDLGVKNSAHRARVVSSLVALRTKQGKGKVHGSSLLIYRISFHFGASDIRAHAFHYTFHI